MIIILANETGVLRLGYQGEKERTKVVFDFADIWEEFPNGLVTLEVVRPKGTTSYPIADLVIDDDAKTASWLVSQYDVGERGTGECQFTYTSGAVAKSKIWPTVVERSISVEKKEPPTWEDWKTELLEAAAEMRAQAVELVATGEQIVADATEQAEAAAGSASDAADSARDAADSAQAASDSASNAHDSELNAAASVRNAGQSEINAAASEANAAQSALDAAQSETNASGSARSASDSADAASRSANSASESANSALGSAQNASRSAGAASQSERNAGISESNASDSAAAAARSAENASDSADTASRKASDASDSAAEALQSKTDAADSATAAQAAAGHYPYIGENGNWWVWDVSEGAFVDTGHPAQGDISAKADKVTGATNGNFAGLDSNGNLTDSGKKPGDFLTAHQDITGKADKVSGAVAGNFAGLDANGNLTDSGKKPGDFLTAHQDISGKQDKITANGLLKGDGAGGVTAAAAGTDYGTYSKPANGIPAADLESGVLTSIIDDTAGDGDTNKVLSADKVTDEIADLNDKIDDLVEVSSSQPQSTDNKLWIKNGSVVEYAVPTYTEFQEVQTAISAIEGMVADAESSTTAASAHAINTVFIMSGKLYMATAAIAVGDTIVTSGTGQNVVEVTLAEAFPHDVQVNGTSVVTDGVANVPKATNANNSWGVVKVGAGLYGDDSGIMINKALSTDIKSGSGYYKPIVPTTQHEAVFYGLAKVAGIDLKNETVTLGAYPATAKAAISQMLNGAVSVSGSTPSFTALPGVRYVCGEVSTLSITVPASGDVEVIFESGSTATVLTVTPPSGVTSVQWANGFDPTSLDANTRYDIIITDGEWGIAASWT